MLKNERNTYNNKVDIWAIGCILHELVFQKKVFEDDLAILQFSLIKENRELQLPPNADLPEKRKRFLSHLIRLILDVDNKKRPQAVALYSIFSNWTIPSDIVSDSPFVSRESTHGNIL